MQSSLMHLLHRVPESTEYGFDVIELCLHERLLASSNKIASCHVEQSTNGKNNFIRLPFVKRRMYFSTYRARLVHYCIYYIQTEAF